MELSQSEKEIIVVSLANTVSDPEQALISEDARKLHDKLVEEWGTPDYLEGR